MFIPLNTLDLWQIRGMADPSAFFANLGRVLEEKDILVIGSYGMDEFSRRFMQGIEWLPDPSYTPYEHSFDLNRNEYPDGRAWAVKPSKAHLAGLAELAVRVPESGDGRCFFDHVLAYRPGVPLVPLFDWHDAVTGGELCFSGFYERKVMEEFCGSLGVEFTSKPNPVIRQMVGTEE